MKNGFVFSTANSKCNQNWWRSVRGSSAALVIAQACFNIAGKFCFGKDGAEVEPGIPSGKVNKWSDLWTSVCTNVETEEAPWWGTMNNNERRPVANNFISTLESDHQSTITINVHVWNVPPLHRRADGLHCEAALWAAAGHRGSNGCRRGQHRTRICNSGRVGLRSAGLGQLESDSPPGGGPVSSSQALLCSLLWLAVRAALHRGSVQEPLRGQDFHSAQHSPEATRRRQEVRGLDGQLCRETSGADWWLHRQRKHHLPHYKTAEGSWCNWGLSDSLDVID